jgi:hypothetical protein
MDQQTLERVLLWMLSGLSGASLEQACIHKLSVPPEQVAGLIAEARKRLTLAAEFNRDELLGTALTRLNDLYGRVMADAAKAGSSGLDVAKALSVQKEINRLAGLYEKQPGQQGGEEGGSGDAGAELQAVREYLLPLALADESYPLREHARLAMMKISELTQRLSEATREAVGGAGVRA